MSAKDVFFIAVGICLAALIGWLFAGDEDA